MHSGRGGQAVCFFNRFSGSVRGSVNLVVLNWNILELPSNRFAGSSNLLEPVPLFCARWLSSTIRTSGSNCRFEPRLVLTIAHCLCLDLRMLSTTLAMIENEPPVRKPPVRPILVPGSNLIKTSGSFVARTVMGLRRFEVEPPNLLSGSRFTTAMLLSSIW